MSPVVLQRNEIIDARTRIAGYRFGVRRPDGDGMPDALSALTPIRAENWGGDDFHPLIGPRTIFLLQLSDAQRRCPRRPGRRAASGCR